MVGTEYAIASCHCRNERAACGSDGRFVSLAKLVVYPPSRTKRKLLPEAIGGQLDHGFTFQATPVSTVS
jgi:hypothetical protein